MDQVLLLCGGASLPASALMTIFLLGRTAAPAKAAESGHELTTAR